MTNPSQPPSQADIATLNVRMANMEKEVDVMQKQLQSYVSQQVSDLQFKNMQQKLDQMDREQGQQLQGLNDKLEKQGVKIDVQGENINKLQIKGLTWIIITVISAIIGVAVAVASNLIVFYITHPAGG